MVKVEVGKCPYCKSYNYTRHELDIAEDNVFANCECADCGESFKEWFALDEVGYYKKTGDTYEEERTYHTTALETHEKDTIKDWCETELKMKEDQFSNMEHYKDYISRVKTIMEKLE